MFHHGWVHVDGTLIDSRIIDMAFHRVDPPALPRHECIVELTDPAGQVVRLKVQDDIDIVLPAIGGVIPLLVKPDGTEAVIDRKDPRVNVDAVNAANEATDQARFDDELR